MSNDDLVSFQLLYKKSALLTPLGGAISESTADEDLIDITTGRYKMICIHALEL